MKSEMDALKFDERQRYCWLLANRATLIVVGICWIAMIVYQYVKGGPVLFLVAMVPAFALIRLVFFKYYGARSTNTPVE